MVEPVRLRTQFIALDLFRSVAVELVRREWARIRAAGAVAGRELEVGHDVVGDVVIKTCAIVRTLAFGCVRHQSRMNAVVAKMSGEDVAVQGRINRIAEEPTKRIAWNKAG